MKPAINDPLMAELPKSENESASRPYIWFVRSTSKALLNTELTCRIDVDIVIQKATWMLMAESVSEVASWILVLFR